MCIDLTVAYKLVFFSGNIGDIHVVGGWRQVFELLAGEDIDGDDVNLGVAVLASLGSAHFHNLAGSLVDDHETVLSKGRALHGKGGRGTGIGRVEAVVLLYSVALAMLYTFIVPIS